MLVFMRRSGERLVVDNHVELTILEIRGNQVRVGIRAPREVPVHRGEVHDAIQRGEPNPVREVTLQAKVA